MKNIVDLLGILVFICLFQGALGQQTPLGLSLDYLLMSSGVTSEGAREYRKKIYQDNKKLVQQHNSNPDRTYDLTLNMFATLNDQQTNAHLLSLIPSIKPAVQLARQISGVRQKPKQNHFLSYSDTIIRNLTNFEENTNEQTQQLQIQVLKQLASHLATRKSNQTEIIQQITKRQYSNNKTLVSQALNQSADQNNNDDRNNQNIYNTRLLEATDILDVDWTCVSGQIRSQGACGSCYAIAAADSLSAMMSIYYYNFYVPLSIQQLMDCPKNSMTLGCDGGFIQGALAYMIRPGVLSQYTYPYSKHSFQNSLSGSCQQFSAMKPRYKIHDFTSIGRGNCLQMKRILQFHPLAVGLSARRMLLYEKGVFNGCRSTDPQDHAVLLIGYNKQKGWRIKNSWGVRWGQNGYAWLHQGQDGNNCRICNMAFYPIPKKGTKNYNRNKPMKRCQKVIN